jgi:hypothetical protein
LIDQTRCKTPFRLIFGDESQNYDASLKKYHARTEQSYDQTGFISEYATSLPWEDWAETVARFLNIVQRSTPRQHCRSGPTGDHDSS